MTTELDLDQLASLWQDSGGHITSAGGWGSIDDDQEMLGTLGVRSLRCGSPSTLPSDETRGYPQRIQARCYWWEADRDAERILGDTNTDATKRLACCDVLVSEAPGDKSSLLVLVSTRNLTTIAAHLKPALQLLTDEVQVKLDSQPLGEFKGDFFTWLIYRFDGLSQLSDDLILLEIRDISGYDGRARGTRVNDGVRLDRGELLAMVMSGETDFGPAAFEVAMASLEAEVALRLFPTGAFSPIQAATSYEHPTDMPDGERVVHDIAYSLLPALRKAYANDKGWSKNRENFAADARKRMRRALDSYR